ncbi:MAG: integrase, partial [bacterium]|nr:integrase [bacterium]
MEEVKEGLNITISKSKTDQEGKGQYISMPREVTASMYCPVNALSRWLEVSGIKEGPLFRSVSKWGYIGNKAIRPKAVCLVIKHYAEKAGLDSSNFRAHSIRSGWITSAAEKGATVFKLKE